MTDTVDTDTGEVQEAQTRPFAAILQELNRGRTHDELSREMQDLVSAVTDTGRKGSLTLTINVNPAGMDGAVQITDMVKVSPPKYDRAASLFYVTDDHNLVRTDPRQMELPLREAAAVTKPSTLREVNQ